jgi:hypothetical protein
MVASPWTSFSADPRRPETATLRASDRDREIALAVLADGYADGRLSKEEYDERAEATGSAKTLGEFPPLLSDLVPTTATVTSRSKDLTLASPDQLRAWAVEDYRRELTSASSGVLVLAAITTGIWFVTGAGFYWPMFVVLVAVANALRLLFTRKDQVNEHLRALQEKQRRQIESGRSSDE